MIDKDESLDAMLYACGYQPTTIETSHGTATVVESEAVPKNGGFNVNTKEWNAAIEKSIGEWIPPTLRDSARVLIEHADSLLTGPRLDRLKPPSFDWANFKLPRMVADPPVMLPLHVYASYKRQCDEGQRCAPLPTGYPKCPCNCGGAFGDCLR